MCVMMHAWLTGPFSYEWKKSLTLGYTHYLFNQISLCMLWLLALLISTISFHLQGH